jgi:hypothetical protein
MNDKPLTAYGLMAKRHWADHCPKLTARLTTDGKLEEALFEAQERTIEEMEKLTAQFETRMTPQQAHDQAWEMIRERYILIPPESGS